MESVSADVEDSWQLEKILTHYIDTINSVSFDRDTKLADICPSPPPLDNIRVTVIVWRLRGDIIRTAPCWVV